MTRQLNLLAIEILDHGYFIGNQQWNQFDVMSPFGRIYYMIADQGWLETDQGRIDLLPGFMYLIPPYTRVNLRTARRIEKFYFHFTLKYAGVDVLEGINRCFSLPLPAGLLEELLAAYHSGGLPDLLQLKALANATLARFIRDGLPDLSHRLMLASTYQEINTYIEQHLSARLTGRSICGALGYSYETMRRAFRRDNGATINQYLNGRLIQEASMQLLLTERTIQQIAAGLGFADEFYFSRLFKQKMEYSPREYRRINAVLRRTT
ncbi:MAG: helix-turn-helix transcriptional regulator [Clostridiaceae bacterium]|nr:helix-turn-helix transcriptional regulator [Clostridiaceae bacterium]